MSPDLRKTIAEDLKAGHSVREVADRNGVSRSAVGRVRKYIPADLLPKSEPKPKPKKRDTSGTPRRTRRGTPPRKRPAPVSVQVDTVKVDKHFHEKAVLEETLRVLGRHAETAEKAATAADKAIEKAQGLINRADNGDSPMIHAAANLLNRATQALQTANSIYRRNRGLDGVTKIEHTGDVKYTVDDARKELAREFGFPLGGSTVEPATVSTGLPTGHEPS